MKAKINITGNIVKDETLKSVLSQYKSFEKPTEAEFVLKSAGGNVDEGDAIYNFIQNLEIPTTAIIEKAYSITAKIARACDTKIVLEGENRVMIHFAWAKVEGKAEKLEMMASILREKEDEFASFYSAELDVDNDTIRALLDNETMLSSKEAVELGFADYETTEVLALSTIDLNGLNKNDKMKNTNKKASVTLGAHLVNALKTFLGNEEVNALKVQTSNDVEVDFVDLEEGDVPKVGDVAEVDGSAIPDGKHIFPQFENKEFVFVGGAVTEVNEEETEEEEEEIVAEEIQQISVWSQEATNTSFEIGDTMTYEYDGEAYNYGAGEYYVPSIGKNVVTDASGVIVAHKDKVVVGEATEEAEVSAELVETLAQFKKGLQEDFDAKLAKEVNALKSGIKSPELNAEAEENGESEIKFASKGAEILASRRRK